jgi:MFS family permease
MSSFKSIISNLVPKHEQGKVIGLDESFAAASRAIVPMIATSLYAVISYRVFGWFGLLLFLGVGSVGVILWKRKSSV